MPNGSLNQNSSGNKQSRGGISKCGNPHARWILIEQATHYRVPPKVSAQLSKRQQGAESWIKELSWKTQTRLSHRFKMLKKRQLHHNKIKVSVARELTAFLWELGTRIEAKQDPTPQNESPPLQGPSYFKRITTDPPTALQSGLRSASRLQSSIDVLGQERVTAA